MGNPANVDFWADADVFFSSNLAAPNPATVNDPFGIAWHQVGVLDGEEGFTTSREEDSTKYFGWGEFITERRSNFAEPRTFTALETNPYTRMLRYPGSPSGAIKRPDYSVKYKVAFEKREGTKVHRLISANYCEIALDGDATENKTDPVGLAFKVNPIEDSSGVFWIEQGGVGGGTTVTALTISGGSAVTVGSVIRLTATATVDGVASIDVTNDCIWSSSDDDTATAHPGGFVVGVDGTASPAIITAELLGDSDTQSVAVS